MTADCDAVGDAAMHTFQPVPELAVAAALKAGTDNDCGKTYSRVIPSALNKSIITEDLLDERLSMLWKVRLRLGHFDPIGPLDEIQPAGTVCSDEAVQTSLEGVIQGAALLKNVGKALPLSAASVGRIALVGPNANYSFGAPTRSDPHAYYGPGKLCPQTKYWTAIDALSKYSSHVSYVAGVPEATSNDTTGIAAAVDLVKAADTTVLAIGTDKTWASEGHDAGQINFTVAQQQLIDQTLAASTTPVVVLLLSAVPMDISQLLASPKVGAVLHLGQPSVTILGAAELLFGKVAPSGRTVQTFYAAEYQDQISIFDFNSEQMSNFTTMCIHALITCVLALIAVRPGKSPFARPDCFDSNPVACPRGTNPGRTHRFFTGRPVVPFGFGLSYTVRTRAIFSPVS